MVVAEPNRRSGGTGLQNQKHAPDLADWPKVTVVVLAWNGWRDTIECLESLQQLTCPAQRVVLVENGSTDDSLERVKAWARGDIGVVSPRLEHTSAPKPIVLVEYDQAVAETGGTGDEEAVLEVAPVGQRLAIIRTADNLGFAGGINVGIRYACAQGAEYVWLLNNDTVVAPDALTTLVNAIKDLGRIGIAGPLELNYDHPQRVVDSVGLVHPWRGVIGGVPAVLRVDGSGRAKVELISGFSMLVSVEAMRAVGLMDERFFLYVEETEWCVRMRREGWKVVYVPTSKVWHKGSRSTGWGSPLMYYYVTRNQLRLFAMHFPYAVPFALARSMLRIVKLLRHRKWAQCRATVKGCLDWARGRSGSVRGYSAKKVKAGDTVLHTHGQ